MGKSHSPDLRVRIMGETERGHSCRATARRFGVAPSTAVRLAQRKAQTGLWPLPGRVVLRGAVCWLILPRCRAADPAGVYRQKTLLASETDRADIVRKRRIWTVHRQPWMKKRP